MPNRTVSSLSCLGGTPVFQPSLPMASPRLPSPETLLPRFEAIVRSGALTKGRELEAFESECRDYLGVKHCVAVSSCTSGLMLVMQALRHGLGDLVKRPKIAVPSFTFMASLSAMVWAGFEPVFIEVDEATMLLDLDDLKSVLERTEVAAVMGVHCFGNPVPTDRIEAICEAAKVPLIFDAAHGFGSQYSGIPVGQAGWSQVFSLTPTKMVVAGEGGIIATDDAKLADALRIGREYGNDGNYDSVFAGLNARLSELHCVLGRESLAMLDEVVAERNRSACALTGALKEIPGISFQSITPDSRTTYKDFTIVVDPDIFGCERDDLAWALAAEGVPSRAYFSPPCHRHTAYQSYQTRPLSATDRLASRCLSIPLLSPCTANPLAEAFSKVHQNAKAVAVARKKYLDDTST